MQQEQSDKLSLCAGGILLIQTYCRVKLPLDGIDWVICGGESGPGYRPHDLAWPRDMRDRCAVAGVAFFYKQSSTPLPGKGIELDGKLIRQFPMLPLSVVDNL